MSKQHCLRGEYAQCVVVVSRQGGRVLSYRYRQNENKMEKTTELTVKIKYSLFT